MSNRTKDQRGSPPTTINNNNIVININKNYNAAMSSKLKQVQEESFEDHDGQRTTSSAS
jgi:hypothetical protein